MKFIKILIWTEWENCFGWWHLGRHFKKIWYEKIAAYNYRSRNVLILYKSTQLLPFFQYPNIPNEIAFNRSWTSGTIYH